MRMPPNRRVAPFDINRHTASFNGGRHAHAAESAGRLAVASPLGSTCFNGGRHAHAAEYGRDTLI